MVQNGKDFGSNILKAPFIKNDKIQNTENIARLLNSFQKSVAGDEHENKSQQLGKNQI